MNEYGPRVMTLEQVRAQWLEHLALLGAAGEHVVTAYLFAAIDALDETLVRSSATRLASADNAVMTLSIGMIDRFGARAGSVTRRQMAEASGDVPRTWATICHQVARLNERETDSGVSAADLPDSC